jgi:hypothetical protein
MRLNQTIITTAIAVAQELFSHQTAEDVQRLKDHFGHAYNEAKIVAEIAVKLALRIGKLPLDTDLRSLSPIDPLVQQAESVYRQRCGA